MKTMKLVICCLLAVAMTVQVSNAQERKAGLTGAAFLKVGVGARAVALGGAVTGLSEDVNQMFYNPAGIALKDEKLQASFSYNKWIADIGHNSAAVSYNWEGVGTIGVGFITFGLSDIPADRDIPNDPSIKGSQIDFNTSSTYNYRDIAYQLTFSRYVIDQLSLGITIKGISETIDDVTASAVAFDFGSVYHIGVLGWTIGARFNNLGSDLKFYTIASPLPMQFTIGTTIMPVQTDQTSIMVALDATKPQDGDLYLFTGAEATFMNLFSVRAGYKLNYSGTNEAIPSTSAKARAGNINTTIEGISAGAGLKTTLAGYTVGIDYSYTQMDLLDAAHRITVAIGMK
jgi:hypothetical protein